MDPVQSIIVTVLLAVWVCVSIGFLASIIQNMRHDNFRKKRELERDRRDLEYHQARMQSLK